MTIVRGFLEDDEEEADDTQPEKFCPACKRALFRVDFDKNQYTSDGYYTYCKECRAAKKKEKEQAKIELDQVETKPAEPTIPRGKVPSGILNGIQVPEDVETPMEGIWAWDTPKGWRVLAIHYSADEDKRPGTEKGEKWIAQKKNDSGERDWKREYELDHTIAEGDPFYPTFNRSMHVRRCTYDPARPLLRFMDFGRAHPAIVIAQVDDKSKLKVLWSEIYTNLNIYQFIPLVLAETNTRFPNPPRIADYGDPAGAQETDKGSSTSILLHTFGIKLIYRFSFIETGVKIIDKKLMVDTDGTPGIWIDPCNKDLIDGFESGYVLDTGASGKDGEGRTKNSPKKDGWYDHIMDALRYGCLNVFSMLPQGSSEEERKAWEQISMWRTNEQAAAREADRDPVGEFNA